MRSAGLLVAVVLTGLGQLAPAAAQEASPMGVVPVKPMPRSESEIWVAGKPSRDACFDVARIGGAIVVDPRTVDVMMRGGARWRLMLAQQCPQLSYYGGFYYQPSKAGKFCAGRDRIMGRAGGSCRVMTIAKMKKLPPRQ